MSEITTDADWVNAESKETAILLLEHKMAGHRLGFDELWNKLSKAEKVKNTISEGSNTELNFFSNVVFPLAEASKNAERATLMSILRENKSPLLEANALDSNKTDPLELARNAELAFKASLLKDKVSFHSVLEVLVKYNLLNIPEKLRSFVAISDEKSIRSEVEKTAGAQNVEEEKEDLDNSEINAWAEALETNFFQIESYKEYIEDKSIFRTHQGVKGNEFERVMVIMDDDEAGGFMFSYEQYFGVMALSKSSQDKRDSGEETGLDRTRRLFYVTSTRAKSSLAHVIYTSDVNKLKANLIERHFAQESEIEIVELEGNKM
ncbi:hypothetical protein [Marinomonas ushuaiensis]|uniref:hypothetical protein n=1 Tax=Marinomonas ushuaiensis TaxID=263818 RepID=UPI0004B689FF|nr:hypothetical protein [Marinomonas ushuaiensis]